MRLPALPFILLLSGCGTDPGEYTLKLRNFVLTRHPASLPVELPDFFQYTNGSAIYTAVFDAGRYNMTPEGALIYTTDDTADTVEKYYQEAIQKNGWKVIQSLHSPGEILVMAESPFSRLVTVIIRGDKPAQIKIYFKRSNEE